MNIIVQTTFGGSSSLNGKSESPNNTLANITKSLLMVSIHKKTIVGYLTSILYESQDGLRVRSDNSVYFMIGTPV